MDFDFDYSTKPASFGVIGLTDGSKTMLLNMNRRGYVSCAYDFYDDNVKIFFENEAKDTNIIKCKSLEEMMKKLKKPRRVVLVIEDTPIDPFIDNDLLPLMSYKDLLINAGTSGREILEDRVMDLKSKGVRYIGSKTGPSATFIRGIIIGLQHRKYEAWHMDDYEPCVKKLKTEEKTEDEPQETPESRKKKREEYEAKFCCFWGVPDRKNDFIRSKIDDNSRKDEILLSGAAEFLKKILELNEQLVTNVFDEWEKEELKEPYLSISDDKKKYVELLNSAVYACKIIIYAKGFALIREVDEIHGWNIDYVELKPSGPKEYIGQRVFFSKIKAAFMKNPKLSNFMLDEDFSKIMNECLPSIKEIINKIAVSNIDIDIFSELLDYYEDFTAKKLLCAKLLNTHSDNEMETESAELDLSPLLKYQNQLTEVLSSIKKIDKILNTFIENPPPENSRDSSTAKLIHRVKAAMNVRNFFRKTRPDYEACVKHLEKDADVSSLLVDIVKKKYSDIIERGRNCPEPRIQRYFTLR